MRNTIIICKKELASYFKSVIAYLALIVFLLLTGWFFTSNFFLIGQAQMRSVINIIPFIFMFFIPAITMGLLSEEKRSGTIEILSTMPVEDYQIVLGKYFAALILIAVSILLTFPYPLTVGFLGDMDSGAVIGQYIGLFLMGAVYAAIGIFGSGLSKNQVVAYIVSFVIIFVLYMLNQMLIFMPSGIAQIVEYLSIDHHFANISRGVIDLRDVLYYFTLIFLGLLFANFTLEVRKWR